jgi:hypothetical protein
MEGCETIKICALYTSLISTTATLAACIFNFGVSLQVLLVQRILCTDAGLLLISV